MSLYSLIGIERDEKRLLLVSISARDLSSSKKQEISLIRHFITLSSTDQVEAQKDKKKEKH